MSIGPPLKNLIYRQMKHPLHCSITLRVFSHESRFKIAVTNCLCDIWITEWTHEREDFAEFAVLAFQSGEKKRGSIVSVFFWHADCYFIWDRISIRKCAVYRQTWLESHIAPPPNHNLEVKALKIRRFAAWFEGCVTGKHLRTIIWIVQLPFVMLICVHTGQNTAIRMIRNSNDHSNFALFSRVKTLSLKNSSGPF